MRYGIAWCDGVNRKKVRTFVFITGRIIIIPDPIPAREVDRLRADTEQVPAVSVDDLASADVGVATLMGILATLTKIGTEANMFIPPTLLRANEAHEAGCKVAQAIYLQWCNHYLTPAQFCEHAGIPESGFDALMDHCKQCHEFLVQVLGNKEEPCDTPTKLPTLQ